MAFQVDQSVTLVNRQGNPLKIAKVQAVGLRKMALSDGSEWRADGTRPWGGGKDPYYMGPWLRATKDSDEAIILHGRYVHALKRINWDNHPLETLKAVYSLLKASETPQESAK